MNINGVFPSKYLKAAELNGRSYKLTISAFSIEDAGDGERKPVIHFQGAEKGLMLNKTNAFEIAAAYGEETDAWMGRQIEVFPSTTQYQGRVTPCIRVRAILPAAAGVPGGIPGAIHDPAPPRQPAPEIGAPFGGDDYPGSEPPF
jgi:hypothetical protein